MEEGSVGREVQQDGKNAGRKLSAKTIKAILELICDEAVSQGGRGGRDIWYSVWDMERAFMGRVLAINTRNKLPSVSKFEGVCDLGSKVMNILICPVGITK